MTELKPRIMTDIIYFNAPPLKSLKFSMRQLAQEDLYKRKPVATLAAVTYDPEFRVKHNVSVGQVTLKW